MVQRRKAGENTSSIITTKGYARRAQKQRSAEERYWKSRSGPVITTKVDGTTEVGEAPKPVPDPGQKMRMKNHEPRPAPDQLKLSRKARQRLKTGALPPKKRTVPRSTHKNSSDTCPVHGRACVTCSW